MAAMICGNIDRQLLRGLSLLYIDADAQYREQLVPLLQQVVREVRVAESGAHGLQLFHQRRPDLVLSELQLPDMEGMALLAQLKREDSYLPIIIITARTEQQGFLQAFDLGVDNYVLKPIVHDRLWQAMTRVADCDTRRRQHQDQMAVTKFLIDRMMLSERLEDDTLRYWSRPTEHFNGDMIAAQRARNGDLFVLVADASGHGLPAAVNLLPLVRVFYTMAKKGFALAVIAEEMNVTLNEQSPPGYFVAATLVRIDQHNRLAEVWNGGNPPVLLLDPAGRVEREINSAHLPIGVISDGSFHYETTIVRCQGHYRLLIYTDGLLDANNSAGERFGEARLRQTLQGCGHHDSCLDALIAQWQYHLGDCAAHDDATLMELICCEHE